MDGDKTVYELKGVLEGDKLDIKELETNNVKISPFNNMERLATFTGNRSFEIKILLMKNCGLLARKQMKNC